MYTRYIAISLGPGKWISGLYCLTTLTLTKWASDLQKNNKTIVELEVCFFLVHTLYQLHYGQMQSESN